MLTRGELNRATLERQMLLARQPVDPVEAVGRLVGVQAQHPASPYLALWNRVDGFDPAGLDEAFEQQALVKATVMRFTLHVVDSADYATFREAVLPSLWTRLFDKRFTQGGFPAERLPDVFPGLAEFAAEPRTNAEMEEWLVAELGDPGKNVWWAFRTIAALWHAPTGPPWTFGQRPAYVASGINPVPGDEEAAAAALQALARRYLAAYGPATAADLALFALVQRSRAKPALAAIDSELEELEGPDGKPVYDLAGAARPPAGAPAPPRLLGMWDNVLLAHVDRSRLIPEEYRKRVIRSNGDTLPALLVDGAVAGVWRPADDGIEVTAFHRLPKRTWEEVAAEAERLWRLVSERDPRVYRRYDRWWKDLPHAEVRTLGS